MEAGLSSGDAGSVSIGDGGRDVALVGGRSGVEAGGIAGERTGARSWAAGASVEVDREETEVAEAEEAEEDGRVTAE